MRKFTRYLGDLVGVKSECVEVGNGALDSVTMDFSIQAQKACQYVQQNYAGQSVITVGLSQGALLARYVATDCEFDGRVTKILSIGGPQMGVSAIPHCGGGPFCWPLNHLTKSLVYTDYIQESVGPAGYFRDYANLDVYLEKSHFLADLNNERNF